MITSVSNRPDASTFREFTEWFKGSMEEMHNVSISTGNRSQSPGSKAYMRQNATWRYMFCVAGGEVGQLSSQSD
jgi:hypothetical protein